MLKHCLFRSDSGRQLLPSTIDPQLRDGWITDLRSDKHITTCIFHTLRVGQIHVATIGQK